MVKNSAGIIDVLVIHQGLDHSFKKLGFLIGNKDSKKCWAKTGTHSHSIKFPVHDIIKTEFN